LWSCSLEQCTLKMEVENAASIIMKIEREDHPQAHTSRGVAQMYEDALARAPLFHDISHRELSWLSEACRERVYPIGTALVEQGGKRWASSSCFRAGWR
jgi:hypothetical protein